MLSYTSTLVGTHVTEPNTHQIVKTPMCEENNGETKVRMNFHLCTYTSRYHVTQVIGLVMGVTAMAKHPS